MSRIDEALKLAARTDGAPRQPHPAAEPLRAVNALTPSTLDRFTAEHHTPLPEAQRHPASTADASQVGATTLPLTVSAALENRLVVGRDISPLVVEQYRRLAAALHELQERHGLKTLMVTSAAPQEGKTLTIANLALTLSESYRQRVLLIDADLRRPSVHGVFAIPNGVGLSDLLNDGGSAMPLCTISPYLSVLTAGRRSSSPLAMLTSDRMRTAVAEAATNFDWVLLDTSPIGLLPDAQLIARVSDGVLFVIGAGITPYRLVQRAIGELDPERIVGTVLNRVAKRTLAAVDHSYDGYYGQQHTVKTGRR